MLKRLAFIFYILLAVGLLFVPRNNAGFFIYTNLHEWESELTRKKWTARAAEVPGVVINEVCWIGSENSSSDEWIELYNNTGEAIDLTGWKLTAEDGKPDIALSGTIDAGGYYLIERTNDDSVPGISADLISSFGTGLGNNGEVLKLYDADNFIVDATAQIMDEKWASGNNDLKLTMERKNSLVGGDEIVNWQSSLDKGGTPKAENSNGAEQEKKENEEGGGGQEGVEGKEGISSDTGSSDIKAGEEEKEKLRNLEIKKPEDDKTGKNNSQSAPTCPAVKESEIKKASVLPGKIVIDEIYPNPRGIDLKDEFIELKNIGGTEINIEGWIIKNKTNRYIVTKRDFNITIVPAGGFLMLGRNIINIALDNNGDQVEIFSNDEKKIDSVSYSVYANEANSYAKIIDKWQWTSSITPGKENFFIAPNSAPNAIADFGGIKEISIGKEIIFDASDSFDSDGDGLSYIWETSDGEKKEAMVFKKKFLKSGNYEIGLKVIDKFNNEGNVLTKIKVLDNESKGNGGYLRENNASIKYKSEGENIVIAQALPNPEGTDGNGEWIKLYNNEIFDVNLGGWIIDDMEGGSNPYYIPADVSISASGYFTLSKDKTGVALNNDSDEIRLFSPDGNLKDVKEYGKTKEGEVIDFRELIENQSRDDLSGALYKNSDAINFPWKNFENYAGEKIIIEGNVSVSPQTLGTQEFYFTDGLKGLKIYCYKKDFPDLSRGDCISVAGVLNYKDGWQLNIEGKDDITVLSYGHPPLAREIKCNSITNEDVYSLIMVKGEVVGKKGQSIYLDDDTGDIKIYIREATGISGKGLTVGKKLSVIGILDYLNNEFRILPRDQEDLVFDNSQDSAAFANEASFKSDLATGTDDNYGRILGAMDAQCKDGVCDAPADLKSSGVLDTDKKRRNLIIYLGMTLAALVLIGGVVLRRNSG